MGVLGKWLRRSALCVHAEALPHLPLRKRNGLQPCGLRVRSVFTMRRRRTRSSFTSNHLDSHAERCSGGRGAAESPRFLHGGVAGSDAPCFPQLSNVSVNRDLKELARLARIEKKLTFHEARHTFGTRLAERVHDPYVILALMGHTSVKTFMIYIHQSGASVAERLSGVEW